MSSRCRSSEHELPYAAQVEGHEGAKHIRHGNALTSGVVCSDSQIVCTSFRSSTFWTVLIRLAAPSFS